MNLFFLGKYEQRVPAPANELFKTTTIIAFLKYRPLDLFTCIDRTTANSKKHWKAKNSEGISGWKTISYIHFL